MAGAVKHKGGVHQLDFIGAFLQSKVNDRVFVKFDSRYAYYFPEYSSYSGRALRLLNLCMELLTLEIYLMMSFHSGWLKQD